jgi:hypothetical protein
LRARQVGTSHDSYEPERASDAGEARKASDDSEHAQQADRSEMLRKSRRWRRHRVALKRSAPEHERLHTNARCEQATTARST